MARGVKKVRVRARVSFDLIQAGDESELVLTPRVQGWINAGLVEVLDGKDQARQSRVEQDDHERVEEGADGGLPSGGEPGEGAGTREDRSSAGVDQG